MSIFSATHKYETVKLRVEDELLLCCARTDVNSEIRDKILFLIQNDIDWDYLLKLASRHRLVPLLYHNINSICPEMVPETILADLKDYFNANVRKNLMMTGELIKVLNLLESEGITAVPYKGPVLASMAYGNIGLREFGDIDIFIEKEEIVKAKEILVSSGYQIHLQLNSLQETMYFKFQREYKFKSCNDVYIEIKWKFSVTSFSFLVDMEQIFNQEHIDVEVNGYLFSSIPLEFLLLVLCIHNAGHYWSNLTWLCDISGLIGKYSINWHDLIVDSSKLGIKRILLINLFLANDLLGLELPLVVQDELNLDQSIKKVSMLIKKRYFFKDKNKLGLIDKIVLRIKIRENFRNEIKDFVNLMLIPTPNILKSRSLPIYLFPIYYLIRIIDLIKRYGKLT